MNENGTVWFKGALFLWLGLFVVLILNKAAWVFPTNGFSLLAFAVSFIGGIAVYRRVISRIRRGELELTGFKKWVVSKGGFVLYPAIIWFPVNKGIPILFDGFATDPHFEVVTIERKEWNLGRRLDCRYEFKIREYSRLVQGKLCIDQVTWENGKSGMHIKLMGRKNLMAFYVDRIDLDPGR